MAGPLLPLCFTIDLSKAYNVLPCRVAHLPTIKRANMQTECVVFVTVKNWLCFKQHLKNHCMDFHQWSWDDSLSALLKDFYSMISITWTLQQKKLFKVLMMKTNKPNSKMIWHKYSAVDPLWVLFTDRLKKHGPQGRVRLFLCTWTETWDFQQCRRCDQQKLRSVCAYAQSGQSLC